MKGKTKKRRFYRPFYTIRPASPDECYFNVNENLVLLTQFSFAQTTKKPHREAGLTSALQLEEDAEDGENGVK